MVNQPLPPEPESESLESVRENLREAQRKLAYYERFGPLLEEQMSTVVAKAAEVTAEGEKNRAEIEREVARLRQEAEALKAECEWRRSEAAAIIAQAHHDAASILARARGDVSTIVNGALTQLEHAQKEVLHSSTTSSEPSDESLADASPDVVPPPASFAAWTPDLPTLEPEGPPIGEDHKDRDQEDNAEPVRELSLASTADDEAHEAAADDAI